MKIIVQSRSGRTIAELNVDKEVRDLIYNSHEKYLIYITCICNRIQCRS